MIEAFIYTRYTNCYSGMSIDFCIDNKNLTLMKHVNINSYVQNLIEKISGIQYSELCEKKYMTHEYSINAGSFIRGASSLLIIILLYIYINNIIIVTTLCISNSLI